MSVAATPKSCTLLAWMLNTCAGDQETQANLVIFAGNDELSSKVQILNVNAWFALLT
jgi:hypothetical protein